MAAVTLTTIAIGAAIGAGVGAVATYAAGGRGDALWKGALVGAVGGAITGGVGSWATAAGYGGMAAGAMAGAAGGVGAGALGTALNGGNSSDYLRNIATGGLMGGALGAAGGAAFGGEAGAAEAGVNPVTGEAVPTGSPEITALPDADAATGMQTGTTTAPAVQASVTGQTAPTTQATTTTPLADTVANVSTGTQPTSLSSTTPSTATPDLGTAAFGTGGTTPSGTTDFTGVDIGKGQVPVDGVNFAENTPSQQAAYWEKYLPNGAPENPTALGNAWGKATQAMAGYPSANTTGFGKMGLEDYLKMQGKAQLVGGGIKALGALATAPETQQNRQQLMDLYNQQNEQNQFYANKLQQSYTNPMGYLGSGEAAATRSAALQKALAMNAAAGRRTQGGALANQLMQAQLANLQNYRQGMPRANYGTAAQNLQLAQQYSPTADIFGGVSSMATPLSLYSLFG